MKKKNDPNKITKHHIIPTSRPSKGIVGVCKVIGKLHELYHALFGNMMPDEIVHFLNKTFWNGNYEITILKRKE